MKILLVFIGLVVLALAFYGALQLKKNIFPSVKKDVSDIGDKLKN